MMLDVARAAEREDVGWIAYTGWRCIARHNVVHVLAGKATVCTVRMLFHPSLAERTPMAETKVSRLDHFEPMRELGLAVKDGKQ